MRRRPEPPAGEDVDALRARILDLVSEYHRLAFPGRDRSAPVSVVPVSGKVFDDRELRALVDASLDFWLTAGRFAERFEREFPKALMLRPLQLRAAAEDAALMTPSAMGLEGYYRALTIPVTIITGADDQIADLGRQSARLHNEFPGSEFIVLPGLGHMIHHLAPDAVADAIDRTAQQASPVW